MAPFFQKSLDGASGLTTGTTVATAQLSNPSLQVTVGSGAGYTLQILGSNDGVGFTQIGSDITAPGVYAISPVPLLVRVDITTAGTAANVNAIIAGETPG